MTSNSNPAQCLEAELEALAQSLVSEVTRSKLHVREGVVMTLGPAAYRRLDCDGRALAYVRCRPRKRMIRIDVSGLWITPASAPPLAVPNAGGAVTLVVRSEADRRAAVAFLESTVALTRAARAVSPAGSGDVAA